MRQQANALKFKMSSQPMLLYTSWITTPLEPMLAIADDKFLYLLKFNNAHNINLETKKLKSMGYILIPGITPPIESINMELNEYFKGKLQHFKTPYTMLGSEFQHQVWNQLLLIPYGQTISYAQQAMLIRKENAHRAVANANGANKLSIIIPCHRVIASNGSLGGYNDGVKIKEWLINHEKIY